jgi:pyruvate formate-lyase activating enzyme-like uncharacterized protein
MSELRTLEVAEEMRFGMVDRADPPLNYIKALEIMLQAIKDAGIELPSFPDQYQPKEQRNDSNQPQ